MKKIVAFIERCYFPFLGGFILMGFISLLATAGKTDCEHCNTGQCVCCKRPIPPSPGPATGNPRTLPWFSAGPAQRSPGNK